MVAGSNPDGDMKINILMFTMVYIFISCSNIYRRSVYIVVYAQDTYLRKCPYCIVRTTRNIDLVRDLAQWIIKVVGALLVRRFAGGRGLKFMQVEL